MHKAFYRYEETLFHYQQGQSFAMNGSHFHKNYEMYYMLSGQRRYMIENEMYDLLPGDMILIPEMTPHKSLRAPSSNPEAYHERYLFSPRKEHIPEVFLPLFETRFFRLNFEEQIIVEQCCKDLQSLKKKDQYTSYYYQANLTKILHTLAHNNTSLKSSSAFSLNDMRMQEAVKYIKENCSQQISLEDLAERYSFTREYFSTIFKKATGYGVNEYLNQMRVVKAINLLTSTDLSITEISNQCGFNDSNYFSAVFRKITGSPPKKFRMAHTKNESSS